MTNSKTVRIVKLGNVAPYRTISSKKYSSVKEALQTIDGAKHADMIRKAAAADTDEITIYLTMGE